MAAKFLILLACLALSRAALVKRDAPNVLEDIQKHAEEFQKTIGEQFNSFMGSQNTQEFNKALKDGSESVATQISAFATVLQGAIVDASGKTKEALEQARANIERTAEDLRKAHPELEQHAAALKDKLQAAVQTTVTETQKLAKQVADNLEQTNAKLAPKLQEAYNDLVKQTQDVQKNLHDAANKQ